NQRPPEPHSPTHASPTCQRRFAIMCQTKELRQGQQGLSGGRKVSDLACFDPIRPRKSGGIVATKRSACDRLSSNQAVVVAAAFTWMYSFAGACSKYRSKAGQSHPSIPFSAQR